MAIDMFKLLEYWITQQRGSMCTEPGIIKAVIAMAHFIET
jgi:hypothetical protein